MALFNTSIGENFKPQSACDRRGLDQLYRGAVAEPVGHAAAFALQRMVRFVVTEIFIANGAGRDEAIRAGAVKLDEQASPRDASDMALEGRADAVGEMVSDQSVDGFAFCRHGTAFGG